MGPDGPTWAHPWKTMGHMGAYGPISGRMGPYGASSLLGTWQWGRGFGAPPMRGEVFLFVGDRPGDANHIRVEIVS